MISVIIPLYNKELSIASTIKSVLNQSFCQFELLIINDGSTDGSLNVIKEFTDSRLKILSKNNGGVSSARNFGMTNSKYDWIALLDGDDIWEKDHLLNISNVINDKNDVNVIATGFQLATKNGDILKKIYVNESGFYNFFEIHLRYGFIVHTSAIVFNKLYFNDLKFDTNLSLGEDTKFWEQMGKKSNFYFIKSITSNYINDSENKAIFKKYDTKKINLYHINIDDISDDFQKKYYKISIVHGILLGFKNKFSLKNSKDLFIKYYKFLGISGFINYLSLYFFKKKHN
nr:glycosyltransferase family A protein [uncultured Flavobacterium sp.]